MEPAKPDDARHAFHPGSSSTDVCLRSATVRTIEADRPLLGRGTGMNPITKFCGDGNVIHGFKDDLEERRLRRGSRGSGKKWVVGLNAPRSEEEVEWLVSGVCTQTSGCRCETQLVHTQWNAALPMNHGQLRTSDTVDYSSASGSRQNPFKVLAQPKTRTQFDCHIQNCPGSSRRPISVATNHGPTDKEAD